MAFKITNECIDCGKCEPECPVGAISRHRSKPKYEINPELCTDCEACAAICPVEACVPAE